MPKTSGLLTVEARGGTPCSSPTGTDRGLLDPATPAIVSDAKQRLFRLVSHGGREEAEGEEKHHGGKQSSAGMGESQAGCQGWAKSTSFRRRGWSHPASLPSETPWHPGLDFRQAWGSPPPAPKPHSIGRAATGAGPYEV